MRFVAGFVMASLLLLAPPQDHDAMRLEPGDDVPFSGWLVSGEDFDAMLQATLDAPLLREEIAAWERGHALAIQAMESAQEALQGCQPKRGVLDRVLKTLEVTAPVVAAVALCSGDGQ